MKLGLLFATGALVWATGASADIISFDLTTGNDALAGQTGDFANVTINLTTATTATVTFTSLCTGGTTSCANGDNIFLMGDGGTADLNVDATSFTVGAISGSNAGTGFTPGPYTVLGPKNVDGFGTFNLVIDSFDGQGHSSDTLSFTLTNTGGTWASANDVLVANANDAVAAAHIFVNSWPADASNKAIVTGFAAGSGNPNVPPQEEVPEPGILALLSLGLLGVVVGTRRRRS